MIRKLRIRFVILAMSTLLAVLLVLDEPFTGLDEDNRRKALDTIRAYPKEAIVLLVTHSREDAEALGAEIIEI